MHRTKTPLGRIRIALIRSARAIDLEPKVLTFHLNGSRLITLSLHERRYIPRRTTSTARWHQQEEQAAQRQGDRTMGLPDIAPALYGSELSVADSSLVKEDLAVRAKSMWGPCSSHQCSTRRERNPARHHCPPSVPGVANGKPLWFVGRLRISGRFPLRFPRLFSRSKPNEEEAAEYPMTWVGDPPPPILFHPFFCAGNLPLAACIP